MGKRSSAKKSKLMRLLFEYLKDSNRSDKQIAKALGVSQPTVSKMKNELLEEGLVRQFSAIPNLAKMGYEILAVSFIKFNMEHVQELEKQSQEWSRRQPEIIFSSRAEGMGFDAVTLSLHKNYAEYKKFIMQNKKFGGRFVTAAQYAIVDLIGGIAKPFSFKYLAEKRKNRQDNPPL
jgi:DNA-binding Lrp family transcriptional regulator